MEAIHRILFILTMSQGAQQIHPQKNRMHRLQEIVNTQYKMTINHHTIFIHTKHILMTDQVKHKIGGHLIQLLKHISFESDSFFF